MSKKRTSGENIIPTVIFDEIYLMQLLMVTFQIRKKNLPNVVIPINSNAAGLKLSLVILKSQF